MWTNLKKYTIYFFLFFNSINSKETKIVGLLLGHNDAPFLTNALYSTSQCVDEIIYLDNQSTDESVALVKAEARTYNVVAVIENQKTMCLPELYQQLLEEGRKKGGTHFLLLHADELLTASIVNNGRLKKTISQLNPEESLYLPLIFTRREHATYFPQKNVPYLGCAFADNHSAFYEKNTGKRIPSGVQGMQWYWQDKEVDGILFESAMKSQYQQDQFLYTYFFSNQEKGFFVDIGAHDGIKWSNTYFFEKKLGWQGICIEPIHEVFKKLVENRSAVCINACVGKNNGTADFFNVHGAPDQLSGLVDTYHPLHKQRMEREVQEDNSTVTIEKVPVFTLTSLLNHYGITHVDFISLDTEGSEMQILEGIDFDNIYIKVMTIENMFYGDQLRNFMAKKGFQLVARLGNCDDVYVNTKEG